MTFDDFHKAYRLHDGEEGISRYGAFGSYTRTFENGDVYTYTETIKDSCKGNGVLYMDSFDKVNTWNGEIIEL